MKKLIITLITVFLVQFFGFTQSAKEVLILAKSRAKTDLKKADSILAKGLVRFPHDHDLIAYFSRLKAWRKNYQEALSKIDALMRLFPNDEEAQSIELDILFWQNKTKLLLDKSVKYNYIHGRKLKTDIYIIKSYINNAEYSKAKQFWNNTYAYHGSSEELNKLKGLITTNQNSFVSLKSSMMILSDKSKPTYLVSIGLGQTKNLPWSANISTSSTLIANFKLLQFEVYPRLSKNNYVFLDGSYAVSKLFDINYFGVELFQSIKKMELSAGYKVYNWEYTHGVMKGSISGYFGRFYLSYRSYIKIDPGIPTSYASVARMYLKNKNHYIEISYANGNDQIFPVIHEGRPNYNSSITSRYQHILNDKIVAHIGFSHRNQIYSEGKKMTGNDFQLGIKKIF